jgi:hypothetical protein
MRNHFPVPHLSKTGAQSRIAVDALSAKGGAREQTWRERVSDSARLLESANRIYECHQVESSPFDDVVSLGERLSWLRQIHLRPVRLVPSPVARAASRHLNYQELSNAMGAPLWHARELLEVLQWI